MKNLIICPVYNEEEYIGQTIDNLRNICNEPILLINDGSTDKTFEIIKSKYPNFLINHPTNMGYGRSLIDGFNFAIKNNFKYIITFDADLQHDPYMIPVFFNAIKQYDVVFGSRYLYLQNHPEISPPKTHYIYHQLIKNIINDTFNCSTTDPMCGFNAYRVEKLNSLDLDIDGYGIQIQMSIKILYKKLKYVEIPIPMLYHNPVRDRIPPNEKTKNFLKVIKSELQKVGHYDEDVFKKYQ